MLMIMGLVTTIVMTFSLINAGHTGFGIVVLLLGLLVTGVPMLSSLTP